MLNEKGTKQITDCKASPGPPARSQAGAGALHVSAPTEREIVMTRTFSAPRRLVFDAFSKPELVRRWLLGPEGWSMPACDIDFRVGGRFRYVWRRDADGTEMGMGGHYKEILAPERIVHTELFDQDWTEGETQVTTVLTEQSGKTTITMTILYVSRAVRDRVLQSGMETGVSMSYDRLERLLAEMGA
jgi:uncharacterized protein YndB with AHSA1/START domain